VRDDIDVDGVANNTLYRVTIDGNNYDYTSDGTATATEIRDGLIAAINGGSSGMTAYITDADSLYVLSDDGETGHNVTVSTGGGGAVLTISSRATPIPVTALTTGPQLVNALIIDTIVTPVSGLSSISNLAEGDIGRDVETDAALRLRLTGARLGAATLDSIQSRVLDEVDGVSTVLVVENRTDATVGVLPPHSIHVIVQGGDDQEIAEKIWAVKPAGIEMYGTTTKTVVDGSGNNQSVKFSRPTTVYGWVRIRYTRNTEEVLPSGADQAIADAILAYGNTFQIGNDMLWQRFLTPVFEATTGIKSAVVELDHTATAGGPPSYVTDTDVAVADDELVAFASGRIDVAEA
jgi:hypothetical protein